MESGQWGRNQSNGVLQYTLIQFGAGVASLTAGKNAEGSRPAGDGDCRFRFPVLEREIGCRSAPLAPVLFRFRVDRWNRMAAFFRLFFGGMVLQPGRERRSIVSFVFKEQSAAGQMAGRKDSSPGSPESMAETSSVSTQEMEQPAVRPGGFQGTGHGLQRQTLSGSGMTGKLPLTEVRGFQ